MGKLTLLSVDFDYFFPMHRFDLKLWQLYDWGNSESFGYALDASIWQSRAVGFYQNNLPLPGLIDTVNTFWSRFKFSKSCDLLVADSHRFIAEILPLYRDQNIINFDAHHDAGYNHKDVELSPMINCANWALVATEALNSKVSTFYPPWQRDKLTTRDPKPYCSKVKRMIDDEKPWPAEINDVFICRSGGWVPPWLDEQFLKFVDASSLNPEILEDVSPRPFSIENVEKEIAMINEMRARFKESPMAASACSS